MFKQAITQKVMAAFITLVTLSQSSLAKTSTMTVHMRATVLPSCSVQVNRSSIEGGNLILSTNTHCNTERDLKISETKAKLYSASTGDLVKTNNMSEIRHQMKRKHKGEPFFLVVLGK